MMYIGQQLPRQATARLRKAGYGRQAGEEVAHEASNGSIIIIFMKTSFSGGISRHTVSLEQFLRDFAIIRGSKR